MESPYRVLFVVGLLHFFLGLGVWALFLLQMVYYPGIAHAHLMIQGFLFSFATGFLMTAVPKFLGALPARLIEVIVASMISLLPWLVFFLDFASRWIWFVAFLQMLWIVFFGVSRFRKRTFAPPPSFIMLPLGLLSGIGGSMALFLDFGRGLPLVYEGVMLAFVLGIGSKLVTALLGWQVPIQIEIEGQKSTREIVFENIFLIEAALFLVGIVLHFFLWTRAADFLWALVALNIGLTKWRLTRKPKNSGVLSWCLWISAWSIVIGLWLVVAFPLQRFHVEHVIYISGMALMTLSIATRVILAHGGYSLALEKSSKALRWTWILFVLAMATRVTAPYLSSTSYFHHLLYAALMLIIAGVIWAAVFLRKVFVIALR